MPQGQLAAEQSTLNAIIKVIAPSLYAWLFAVGVRRGVIGLPFYSTALLMFLSAAVASSIPRGQWGQMSRAPPPRADGGDAPRK